MREEDSKLFSIIEILEYIQLFNFKILTDKILTDKILKNANGCKNFLVQKKMGLPYCFFRYYNHRIIE